MTDLAAEARNHLKQGRLPEAESAFERLLQSAPDNVEALNVMGLAALRNAQPYRGVDLLERAARADPADALTQHHLGRAYESAGDLAHAAHAHAAAVRLRPDFLIARLYWAMALERSNETDHAVVQFSRVLDDAQKTGRWLNPQTTPAPLRPLVEHAVVMVRRGRAQAFERLFAPLVQRYGGGSLTRVEQTLRLYFNQQEPAYADPRQRPTFLYMPGLPASPYIDRAALSWLDELESRTRLIQDELASLLNTAQGSERVFTSAAIEAENLRGSRGDPNWTGYYFYRHGLRREDNCASCPRTAQSLDSLPLSHVREHGPEVLFSVFSPGTHLLPHRGVTNTRLVGHLPILVPCDCALKVGGEVHEWAEGRVVVFDDTYEHEAWNRSDSIRVVLIFDIWNPYLTEVEREAIADLIGSIGDFRKAVECA